MDALFANSEQGKRASWIKIRVRNTTACRLKVSAETETAGSSCFSFVRSPVQVS